MTTVYFEIYFEDLTEAAQHYLCRVFKTTPEEENWETVPLAVLGRELEESVMHKYYSALYKEEDKEVK